MLTPRTRARRPRCRLGRAYGDSEKYSRLAKEDEVRRKWLCPLEPPSSSSTDAGVDTRQPWRQFWGFGQRWREPPSRWRTAVFSPTPREVQGECSISRSVGTLILSIPEAPPWRPRLTLISPQHPTSKCYPVGVRASTCEFWGVGHNSNLSKCLTQKCVEVMETRGGREFLRKDMQIGKGESQSKDHRGGSSLPGVSAIRVWVPPQDILSHRYLILW